MPERVDGAAASGRTVSMCGRIVRTSPAEVLAAEFGARPPEGVDLRPRYNLCPGEDLIVVVQKGEEKWQIACDKATQGSVKVGDKVTIQYQMVAKEVEVKGAKK